MQNSQGAGRVVRETEGRREKEREREVTVGTTPRGGPLGPGHHIAVSRLASALWTYPDWFMG